MKKILGAMMVVMAILTGLVWYAKKNHIALPGVRPSAPSTNWQWSNDWSNPTGPTFDDGSRPDVSKPIGPNGVRVKPEVQPPAPTPPAEITLMGYNEAIKKSAEEGKPVLVMFTASWCNWCTKFKKEVLVDPSVKAACQNYLFTMIDADQEKNAVRKFGVTGLPSFLITNSKEEKLKFEGKYMDARTFVNWLNNPSLYNQPKAQPTQPQPPTQPTQPTQPDRRQPFRRQQPPGNC
jgi:thiol-disulfide isomerase/thioredoxin